MQIAGDLDQNFHNIKWVLRIRQLIVLLSKNDRGTGFGIHFSNK